MERPRVKSHRLSRWADMSRSFCSFTVPCIDCLPSQLCLPAHPLASAFPDHLLLPEWQSLMHAHEGLHMWLCPRSCFDLALRHPSKHQVSPPPENQSPKSLLSTKYRASAFSVSQEGRDEQKEGRGGQVRQHRSGQPRASLAFCLL